MTRVLVVWEDTYFQPLDDILNRVVKKRAPRHDASRPTVLHHTARSNAAFERYVETTWPRVSARGLPMSPGAIDHVVCVVDADKLSDFLRQHVSPPPTAASDVVAWHATAEQLWNSHLRSKCPPGGPTVASVHGVVLRWSKESVLLAGYDQAPFAQHLDCDHAAPEIEQYLKTCNPVPSEIGGEGFSNSFRRPLQCLRGLRKAAKLAELPKNSPEFDDALRKLGRESLGTLCERTPDIPRVAELIWKLHATASTPPAAT
ncbi:MAG TPA: hypothetical protein VF469_31070 [Kofleriaceae bacterium]